ncbi:hypothetical protein ACFXG1_04310 [Streptomyces sp. NPDC059248]|uniref:hypothetical protein n=1 Tax=Streptomyces sp. NPDC059248 TaxID=3346791 RepID=UPI0036C812E5
MAEIDMPGAEVERMAQLIGRVMELVDTRSAGFDAVAVGPPLAAAGRDFDDAWSDGRFQLKRECKGLKEGCEAIVKGFADADREMAATLKGDGGGAGGNR